jgi:phosphohistidine phosphatase
MRRLLLLRHAKAVPLSSEDDFGRELTERGRDDARRIGVYLADRRLTPDRALYSGAARTRETCRIVAQAQAHAFEAVEQNALYEASRFLIMGLLRALPVDARTHLIVGHNPGMADVAHLLAGEGSARERLHLQSRFPTGALAVIAFDRPDWSELGPGVGRLEYFVTPADLRGPDAYA